MITLALIMTGLVALYLYGTQTFDYWRKKGVKHDRPVPFFGNNSRNYMMRASVSQLSEEMYRKYPNDRVVGFYRGLRPELVLRDPDLVKRVLTTDFAHFYPRGLNPHKEVEPLLKNLFFADGDLWRLLRQRMTPAFTSGKLKAMFPLIEERAERLRARALDAAAGGRAVDARDLMARYTTDFIGACGFGLDSDSLQDENSAFRKLGATIFDISAKDVIVAILPFGEGPRACIGERLGLMQSLAGLAAVLSVCSVRPAPGAPRSPPVDARSNIVQVVRGGVPLVFLERDASRPLAL